MTSYVESLLANESFAQILQDAIQCNIDIHNSVELLKYLYTNNQFECIHELLKYDVVVSFCQDDDLLQMMLKKSSINVKKSLVFDIFFKVIEKANDFEEYVRNNNYIVICAMDWLCHLKKLNIIFNDYIGKATEICGMIINHVNLNEIYEFDEISSHNGTAIIYSIKNELPELMKYFLEKNDYEAMNYRRKDGETALTLACSYLKMYDVKIIEDMIDIGHCDYNIKGNNYFCSNTSIGEAISYRRYDVVSLLLDKIDFDVDITSCDIDNILNKMNEDLTYKNKFISSSKDTLYLLSEDGMKEYNDNLIHIEQINEILYKIDFLRQFSRHAHSENKKGEVKCNDKPDILDMTFFCSLEKYAVPMSMPMPIPDDLHNDDLFGDDLPDNLYDNM